MRNPAEYEQSRAVNRASRSIETATPLFIHLTQLNGIEKKKKWKNSNRFNEQKKQSWFYSRENIFTNILEGTALFQKKKNKKKKEGRAF